MTRARVVAAIAMAALLGGLLWTFLRDDEVTPAQLVDGDKVTVTEIIKGDEVEIAKGKQPARVRLLGILAVDEELQDPALVRWRQESLAYLRTALAGKEAQVTLGKVPRDDRGRFLAYLSVDGGDLGEKAVADGKAMVYTEYGFAKEQAYLAAEAKARGQKSGLWADAKAEMLVRGLREQWARFRSEREGKPASDPLLEPAAPAPAPEAAPAAAPTK